VSITSTATQRWVLALTATAAFMVVLDQLVVATALNAIRDDLHTSLATLDWTVSAYSLSFAVLLITGAALGDRYGRRRMFVTGIVVFCLASAACALAPTTGLLIAARTVQGAGSALVMPLAVALLTAAFPVERRGPVVGIFTALTGLAVAGGPVVGGAVTEGIAWQWIFWLNVPIGAVLIPLVLRRIDEVRGGPARFDVPGVLLVSGSLSGIVWGLIRADAAGWTSTEVLTTMAAGAVLGLAFVRWELRTPQPMLPMQLFRIRSYAAGNAAGLLLTTSLFGTVFLYAQYLQISLGYDPFEAGLRFVPWTAALFFVAPLAGALNDRIGSRPLLVAGLFVQAVGLAWVAYAIHRHGGYGSSVLAIMISGCGTSMALPSTQNAVMNAVGLRHLGTASGTFNSVRQLGGVLGVAIVSAVFAANGSYAGPDAYADGVAPAVAVTAAIALAGAAVGLFVSGRGREQQAPLPARIPATVGADVAA
jgi:EmrB/QacA subfamily drug resistance transporter